MLSVASLVQWRPTLLPTVCQMSSESAQCKRRSSGSLDECYIGNRATLINVVCFFWRKEAVWYDSVLYLNKTLPFYFCFVFEQNVQLFSTYVECQPNIFLPWTIIFLSSYLWSMSYTLPWCVYMYLQPF